MLRNAILLKKPRNFHAIKLIQSGISDIPDRTIFSIYFNNCACVRNYRRNKQRWRHVGHARHWHFKGSWHKKQPSLKEYSRYSPWSKQIIRKTNPLIKRYHWNKIWVKPSFPWAHLKEKAVSTVTVSKPESDFLRKPFTITNFI